MPDSRTILKKDSLGRPHISALFCITMLVFGLLLTNFFTQHSTQQANLRRLQLSLQERALGISYFFSERKNDIAGLASAKQVTAYFLNESLGMSMTYGLKTSLNNITSLFENNLERVHLEGNHIYRSLRLLDNNGHTIVAIPEENPSDPMPSLGTIKEHTVIIDSYQDGLVTVTCPVTINGKGKGYVVGTIRYDNLIKLLMGSIDGFLFITDRQQLVYQSRSDETILASSIAELAGPEDNFPLEIPENRIFKHAGNNGSRNELMIFSAIIPGYPIKIYLVEDSQSVKNSLGLFFLTLIMVVLSIGVLIIATTIIRYGTRSLILETSLAESRRREKEVAEKKGELDSIIRNFLDTLIVVDTSLKVVRVNTATCNLLGYPEDELLGTEINSLFSENPETVTDIFQFYKRTLSDKTSNCAELRNIGLTYIKKDGTTLPMSFNLSLLHDDSGQITGVVAGAKDVSELKTAMDRLERQKDYIENIFDVVPEGLLAISPAGDIVKSNLALSRTIAHWAERMAIGKDAFSRELLDNIRTSLNKGNKRFLISRNQTIAHFYCTGTPVPSLPGIEHVVMLMDITTRHEAEEHLRLLATVIDQTIDSVIITNPEGIIHYVNPATESNTGYSREELIGQTPNIFKSGLVSDETYQELRQTLDKGMVWSGKLINRRKDGSTMEEIAIIAPVYDEDRKLSHYAAIQRDISKLELLQRQLLQAQKLEAIGQLAAGIAHEINTPMQYVQNNMSFFGNSFQDISSLLKDYQQLAGSAMELLPESAAERLQTADLDFLMAEIPDAIIEAQEGINRVVKIISAMKEFSHPSGEGKVLADLNRALASTITVSRNEWKYVATMVENFDQSLPLIPCLPDQFNQAVLNLIINAAHAIEEAGAVIDKNPGRITISTSHDDYWAEVRVSDTGNGIPENIRERVYEPFFTTKDVGKGTGQGLAIIYDVIVHKHGGTIDFESEEGIGTTFIIRLPKGAESS